MKNILIIILIVLLCWNNPCVAQYSPVTNVKTPNGSTVQDTWIFTGTDYSLSPFQLSALSANIAVNYNGAVLEKAPSDKYNCHAYAWHVSEGGNPVWIGYNTSSAENIYWTDGSYMEVPENVATKVSYHETGNHSAIRLDSEWYRSKWGANALVKHHPDDVPSIYNASMTKKYYHKKPIIFGPSSFHSSATFQILNMPANAIVSVETSSPELTAVVSGNTITVTRIPYNGSYLTYSGEGWIQVIITVGTQIILSERKLFISGEFFGVEELTAYHIKPQHFWPQSSDYCDWCSISVNSQNKLRMSLMGTDHVSCMSDIQYQLRLVRQSNHSVAYVMPHIFNGNEMPFYDVTNETPLYEDEDEFPFHVEYNGIEGSWYDIEMRVVCYNKNSLQWRHNLNGEWHFVGSVLYGSCSSNDNPQIAIYPNPNEDGIFTLQETASNEPVTMMAQSISNKQQLKKLQVEIYSSTGNLVKKLQIDESDTMTLNIGKLPKGNYVMKILKNKTVVQSTNIIIK